MITGDGLVLRPWHEGDLARMVELWDEPSIDEWTPLASPFDDEAARRYLASARRAAESGAGEQLAVEVDGAVIAEVLAFRDGDAVELAYAVGLAHRGHGYAARAIRVLLTARAAGWRADGVTRVVARIRTDNLPSIAVAEAVGLTRTDAPEETRRRKGRVVRLHTWAAPNENLPAVVTSAWGTKAGRRDYRR